MKIKKIIGIAAIVVLCGKREMQAYLRVALSTEQDTGRLEKGLSILRENVKKA